jgi:hypothetical protein
MSERRSAGLPRACWAGKLYNVPRGTNLWIAASFLALQPL